MGTTGTTKPPPVRTPSKNRLKSIVAYRGAEAASEEYDRLLTEWQEHKAELERWLEENPTGNASEP